MSHDRRRHERLAMVRPCKLNPSGTLVYVPGRTVNVSAGGALVEVRSERPLAPGDEVAITVAPDDARVLISDSMVRARIVRVDEQAKDRRTVAVEFVRAGEASLAA